VDVSVVASVLLGVVMLIAGASKVASQTWPTQAANLGVPRQLALAVPWVELMLGAGLIVQLAPVAFGGAAAALLVSFTALLMSLLIRGQRPPCACFGGRTPRPISWLSAARNLGMLALAAATILG
jgi:Methylamine utilisation protein MauE